MRLLCVLLLIPVLANAVQVKPTIQGSLTQSCIDNSNCVWDSDFGGCAGVNDGQIQVTSDYVTLQDMKVSLAKCRGIQVKDSAASGQNDGTLLGFRAYRMETENTGWNPLVMETGVKDIIVSGGTFTHFNKCEASSRLGGTSHPTGAANCVSGGGGGWPGGVALVRNSNAKALIENNDIYLGYGEGINVLSTDGVIVRGNRIGNLHSGAIYVDQTQDGWAIVESNITWGAGNKDTGGGVGTNNFAIGGSVYCNVENSAASGSTGVSCISRNNIHVDVDSSALAAGLGSTAAAAGADINVKYLGNTYASTDGRQADVWNDNLSAINFGEFSGISNILYTTDPGAVDRCRSQVTNNYNIWGNAISDSDCGGANDQYSTNPSFTETDYSNFDLANWDNQPTVEDFRLLGSSAVLGDGAPTLETDSCISDSIFDDLISEMSYPFTPTLSNWQKCLYYDFEGTTRDASAPDPGALEYAP